MKRNRRVAKKMSVVASTSMRIGAVLVFFFVMVILNLLSSSSCKQLENANGTLEREITKLEDACTRESTRWEELKTPESIERALVGHGLLMRPPSAKQTVRLDGNGRLLPNQLAVKNAAQRGVGESARTRYQRKRTR